MDTCVGCRIVEYLFNVYWPSVCDLGIICVGTCFLLSFQNVEGRVNLEPWIPVLVVE